MAYGSVLTDVVQSSTVGTPPQFNDGGGTQTGTLCRAWVNFDGTASSPIPSASFNVTSITKNSTGDYTINFTMLWLIQITRHFLPQEVLILLQLQMNQILQIELHL